MWKTLYERSNSTQSVAEHWGWSRGTRNTLAIFTFTFLPLLSPDLMGGLASRVANGMGAPALALLFTTRVPLPDFLQLILSSERMFSYAQALLLPFLMAIIFGPRVLAELRLLPPVIGGVTDQPVHEAVDDAFNRLPVALAIRSLLLNPKSEAPFTIAITAPWGSGKTSVLNLVDTLMRGRMSVVRLNPWHFREEGQLLASLLQNIRESAIPKGLTWINVRFRSRLFWLRNAQSILKYSLMLLALSVGLLAVGRWPSVNQLNEAAQLLFESMAGAVGNVARNLQIKEESVIQLEAGLKGIALLAPLLLALRSIVNQFSSFTPAFLHLLKRVESRATELPGSEWGSHAGLRYRFQQEFTMLCAALGSGGLVRNAKTRPGVVLLIDDLDRCEPRQIEAAVSTLNFLFSTPASCFAVVGMDWEKVVAALSLHFSGAAAVKVATNESMPEAISSMVYAEQYLEKIIQLRIELAANEGVSATIAVTAPKDVLSTVNWWALPSALTEEVCEFLIRIGAACTRFLRVVVDNSGIWLTTLGLSVRSRTSQVSGASRSFMAKVTDYDQNKARKNLLIKMFVSGHASIAFLAIALIPVGLAIWRLGLRLNSPDLWLAFKFTLEALVAVWCCSKLATFFWRRSIVADTVEKFFEVASPSGKIGIFLMPVLLFLCFSREDIYLIIAPASYFGFAVFLAKKNMQKGRATKATAQTLDFYGCFVVILMLVAIRIPGGMPRIFDALLNVAYVYFFVCIFVVSLLKETPGSRHMTRCSSAIFNVVRQSLTMLLKILRFLTQREIVFLFIILTAILWTSLQAPPQRSLISALPTASSVGSIQTGGIGTSDKNVVHVQVPAQEVAWNFAAVLAVFAGAVYFVYWGIRTGYINQIFEEFMTDHVVAFESALVEWQPRLRLLGLNPRAEKQLINRSRYVVNRWHVECDSITYRWELWCARKEQRLRGWLNQEEWSVEEITVQMNAALLSNLTLLNSLTFGHLQKADAASIESLIEDFKLSAEISGILRSICADQPDVRSVPYRQLQLWRRYEDTLPFPISWRPKDGKVSA